MNQGLTKNERLYLRDEMSLLFEKGKGFHEAPFFVKHILTEQSSTPLKIGISIPKKKFKNAVDRNLLKRRTKEAFRIHREELKSMTLAKGKTLIVMFIYSEDVILPFIEIEHKIISVLNRLTQIHG